MFLSCLIKTTELNWNRMKILFDSVQVSHLLRSLFGLFCPGFCFWEVSLQERHSRGHMTTTKLRLHTDPVRYKATFLPKQVLAVTANMNKGCSLCWHAASLTSVNSETRLHFLAFSALMFHCLVGVCVYENTWLSAFSQDLQDGLYGVSLVSKVAHMKSTRVHIIRVHTTDIASGKASYEWARGCDKLNTVTDVANVSLGLGLGFCLRWLLCALVCMRAVFMCTTFETN